MLLSMKLVLHEFLVLWAPKQQFIMNTCINDLSFIHIAYLVGVADCGQPMCHNYHSPFLHQVVQGLLHNPFALAVEGTGGLIQQKESWVCQQSSSYCQPLFLSAAQFHTPLADKRFVAIWEILDIVMCIGMLACRFHLRLWNAFAAASIAKIFIDAASEQRGLLLNQREIAT